MATDTNFNLRLCFFKLGNYQFAIQGHYIQEIVVVNRITPVPRTNDYLWGLITVDSSILPLINSYTLFQQESTTAELAIVLDHNDTRLAFALTSVDGFVPFEAQTEELPLDLDEALAPFVKASAMFEGSSYFLLDAERLIDLTQNSLVLT